MSGNGDDGLTGLSEKDQQQLDIDKRKIRLENEKYMRSHPELALITTVVLSEVLKEAPEDPVTFVAQYMTEPDLKGRVMKAANTIGVS
mmetsp:Transcript_30415/g.47650  ORF Transcript_30415/g.47650 Transcript_30415/m.47650 type:complete len:88 (-) Transcript_30415:218-481(-)